MRKCLTAQGGRLSNLRHGLRRELVAAKAVVKVGRVDGIHGSGDHQEVRVGTGRRIGSGSRSAQQKRRRRVARQAKRQRRLWRHGPRRYGTRRETNRRRHLNTIEK